MSTSLSARDWLRGRGQGFATTLTSMFSDAASRPILSLRFAAKSTPNLRPAAVATMLAVLIVTAPAGAQTTGTAGNVSLQPPFHAPARQGLYFKPDAAIVYQSSDFRLTAGRIFDHSRRGHPKACLA